jgi:hypothetical protein
MVIVIVVIGIFIAVKLGECSLFPMLAKEHGTSTNNVKQL